MTHMLTDSGDPIPQLSVHPEGFAFQCPVSVFKADGAPVGKQRRIGGIISTENPDRQKETILQDGLTFDDFLAHGWFNDNHSQVTTDVVGYPESVKRYVRGDTLPDGTQAEVAGTWCEGFLLDTPKASAIWDLARALQKTHRRLGYSVEGQIVERQGPDDSIIAAAKVRNVAITNCPVNTDARLEVLARSLAAYGTRIGKAMTLTDSSGSAGPVKPNRPYTGQGAGQVISRERLDRRRRLRRDSSRKLSRSEAAAYVKSLLPDASETLVRAIVAATISNPGRGI